MKSVTLVSRFLTYLVLGKIPLWQAWLPGITHRAIFSTGRQRRAIPSSPLATGCRTGADCQPQHGSPRPAPAAPVWVQRERPTLGQAASPGCTPTVSICFQINLPVLPIINGSLKTCKASKGQISVLLFLGCIHVCIYICTGIHIWLWQRENICQDSRKKDSFSVKALKGLTWTRRPVPKPLGTLKVQFYEHNNSCKFLNYRAEAWQLQTVSIYC